MAPQQPQSLTVREDPGPRGQSGYDWAAIAEELRQDPGQWHKVFDRDRLSLVVTIRQEGIAALRPILRPGQPGPGFQVQTRNNEHPAAGPRVCRLHLRYVPGEEEG